MKKQKVKKCAICDGIIEEGEESENYIDIHKDCGEEYDLKLMEKVI